MDRSKGILLGLGACLVVGVVVGRTVLDRRNAASQGQAEDANTPLRIGNTMAYTGPFGIFGPIGRMETAYFKKINDEGGIAGRKVEFISVDDTMSPTRALEATRQLVEHDHVVAMFSMVGAPTCAAARPYLNEHQVPQLFVLDGDPGFANPKRYPWTVPGYPPYSLEVALLAQHVMESVPAPKIAVLYQNDEYGQGHRNALRRFLGDKAKELIVLEQSFEPLDTSVQSQVVNLKNTGANVFFDFSTPGFAFQALKKAHEMGWKALHLLPSGSSSGEYLMSLLGDMANGAVAVRLTKDPSDEVWANDAGMKRYKAFCAKYYPDGSDDDTAAVGYSTAQMLEAVLRAAGDDLSRENLLRQATHLTVNTDLLLPGIQVQFDPQSYWAVKSGILARWEGTRWTNFGNIRTMDPATMTADGE